MPYLRTIVAGTGVAVLLTGCAAAGATSNAGSAPTGTKPAAPASSAAGTSSAAAAPSAAGATAQASSAEAATTTTQQVDATSVDYGPTTFPVTLASGQTASGYFSVAVRSAIGPAIKVVHPAGAWTNYKVSVMWVSHTAVKLQLDPGVRTNYSGTWDPGYSRYWSKPAVLSPAVPYQLGLAATFNGGFVVHNGAARGGYWDYGAGKGAHGIGPATSGAIVYDPTGTRSLVKGAASIVMRKDGTWALGRWGSEVTMGTSVAYVRQNLLPLIDGGVISSLTKSSNCEYWWGQTLHGGCVQWRSGLGITSTGDLIYVSAYNVNAYQLAVLLKLAGSVRAMELDINPEWMSAMWYSHNGSYAVPHVLRSTYFGAYHYISGSVSAGTAVNRDFFSAYLR